MKLLVFVTKTLFSIFLVPNSLAPRFLWAMNNDIAHIFTVNNCSKTHIVCLTILVLFPFFSISFNSLFSYILLLISNSFGTYGYTRRCSPYKAFLFLNLLKNNSIRKMIETVLFFSRLFACVNVLGSIGVYFLLPETKGIFIFIFK